MSIDNISLSVVQNEESTIKKPDSTNHSRSASENPAFTVTDRLFNVQETEEYVLGKDENMNIVEFHKMLVQRQKDKIMAAAEEMILHFQAEAKRAESFF